MTKALLLPLFVQVALTFAVTFALARARVDAVKSGAVKLKEIALSSAGWPDPVRQIANNYQNQLELPVLFYALIALALASGAADRVLVGGAWLFVATRLAHAGIHVGGNNVLRRFQAFAAGVLVLAALWLYFAARILVG